MTTANNHDKIEYFIHYSKRINCTQCVCLLYMFIDVLFIGLILFENFLLIYEHSLKGRQGRLPKEITRLKKRQERESHFRFSLLMIQFARDIGFLLRKLQSIKTCIMYVIQSLRILLIDLIFIQNQEEYTESNSITFFSFVLVIVFQTITVFKYDNEKKLWTPTSPVCIFQILLYKKQNQNFF